jgi:hypothetical protein
MAAALAGCAPPVFSTAHPAQSGSTITPTPTPTAPAKPVVRFSTKCDDIISATALSTIVGTSVTLKQDETSKPTDLASAASLQYGTLNCVWGGMSETDGGFDQGLTLTAAPDAASAFGGSLAALKRNSPPTAVNNVGDRSEYQCEALFAYCVGNMLVGSTWVYARLQFEPAHLTKTSVNSSMQRLLATAASVFKAATVTPAWTPPAPLPGFCAAPSTTSALRNALGSPGLSPIAIPADAADISIMSRSPAVLATCGWKAPARGTSVPTFSEVGVVILDGGGWAMPDFLATPPSVQQIGTYSPTTIAGTGGALLLCALGQCDALATVGTSLVEIRLNAPSLPAVQAALPKIVALIAAS